METNKVRYTRFNGLTLIADTGNGDYATLVWGCRNGNPRITVYTSKDHRDLENKIDYSKVIIAPFDLVNATNFLTYCLQTVTNKSNKPVQVDCLNNKFKDRNRTKEIITQAVVIFNKDAKGYNIKIYKDKDKVFTFYLHNSDWHKYYIDGQLIPQEQAEVIHVSNYLKSLLKFIDREVAYVLTVSADVEQPIPQQQIEVQEDHVIPLR